MESATVSSKPLTKEETKILLGFIESSKIIYNKTTNATTNKMKNEEWMRIANKFNAVVITSHRTPQQLRLKWENLKKNSRKRKTQIRMNNIKTGGGGPDYIPPDDVLDRVAALLGSTAEGLMVAYGGDADKVIPESILSIGDGNESDTGVAEREVVKIVETATSAAGDEVLGEFVVTDTGACSSTPKPKEFPFTPRASGFKRKQKSDENRSARNKAIADYYTIKAKVLDANLEYILLENKKLKLEIENLQNKD